MTVVWTWIMILAQRTNLIEALSPFFETAAPSEVARRFRSEVFVAQVEGLVG